MHLRIEPSSKDITILLPVHNEAWRIEDCIKNVESALKAFTDSFELIVVEDGSRDGTVATVSRLCRKNPNLILLHSKARLGKGGAVKRGVHEAKGDVVVFMDADLATDLKDLRKLITLTRERGGIVIGSRHVAGSKVKRPISRTLFSLAYNSVVSILFFDHVKDHQCGFKAMELNVARKLCESVEADGFFFDTELILRCKIMGFPLLEIPVSWSEKRTHSESKVNLSHDAYRMGKDLLKFKRDHTRGIGN